jgi:hypothetical protein
MQQLARRVHSFLHTVWQGGTSLPINEIAPQDKESGTVWFWPLSPMPTLSNSRNKCMTCGANQLTVRAKPQIFQILHRSETCSSYCQKAWIMQSEQT